MITFADSPQAATQSSQMNTTPSAHSLAASPMPNNNQHARPKPTQLLPNIITAFPFHPFSNSSLPSPFSATSPLPPNALLQIHAPYATLHRPLTPLTAMASCSPFQNVVSRVDAQPMAKTVPQSDTTQNTKAQADPLMMLATLASTAAPLPSETPEDQSMEEHSSPIIPNKLKKSDSMSSSLSDLLAAASHLETEPFDMDDSSYIPFGDEFSVFQAPLRPDEFEYMKVLDHIGIIPPLVAVDSWSHHELY